MNRFNWIKAGLLTATFVGLAVPAEARSGHDDKDGGRQSGSSQRSGGDHGRSSGGDHGRNGGNDRPAPPRNTAAPQAPARPAPSGDSGQRPEAPRGYYSGTRAPNPPQSRPTWGSEQRRDNDRDNARNDRNQHNWSGNQQGRPGNAQGQQGRPNGDRDRRRDARHDDNRGRQDRNWNPGGNRNDGRHAQRPPVTNRWDGYRRWDRNDWRRDRRYDWHSWRNSHRDIFRLPRYYVPFGWTQGYYRFSIGFYLDDILFGARYWIDDPYRYRLPPAYGHLRWIRYYDDALLVDMRDGYVVDVVYDVFW